MNDHPLNLTIRFLLEIAALVIFALWGWRQEGVWKYVAGIGLPLIAMSVWGAFRVPGDPGTAPVAVSGIIRLLIEGLFFGGATAALFSLEHRSHGWMFLIIILVHYIVSYGRLIRLLKS